MQAMEKDNKTTATQLQFKLASYGAYLLLATILSNRRLLGWIYQGSAYCQLIDSVNKEKRLEWARNHLHDNSDEVIIMEQQNDGSVRNSSTFLL